MLIDQVCDALRPAAAGHTVADVRIGLGYTGALLDNGRCGLAYTFRQDTGPGCCVLTEAGSLSGKPATELAEGAHARNLIVAAVGLATLNALAPPAPESAGDILDILSVGPADAVGMVGFFGPLVEPLKRMAKTLHIIEQREDLGPRVLPQGSSPHVLPDCQVVIITGTALLNRTLDGILDSCRGAREIAILGPSTPLLPEVFAARGVTLLSGIEVIDSRRALRVISEGGGTRQLLDAIRKVSLRIQSKTVGSATEPSAAAV